MDIKEALAKHGNVWDPSTNSHMMEIYEPLHANLAASFKDTVTSSKGLKYGSDERHRVDIYYPLWKSEISQDLLPVVILFHGGAFVGGDNDITPSMHGNIGNFFASSGCVCALATYRVVPQGAHYPSGAEDITLALQWLQANAPTYGGDAARITAVGQSSGGAHLASALFTGALKGSGVDLQGAALLSAPLWYDLRQERRKKAMVAYHNTDSEEGILTKAGVSVFRDALDADIFPCDILLMLGEFDPNEIVDGNLMFVNEYRKRYSRLPVLEVMGGHNHISYWLGMGLPEELAGPRILKFVSKHQ